MEQSYTPMSKPNHDCNANLDISTAFHGSIESYTSSVPNDYLTPYSPDAIQSMKCQECVMNIDEGCRRLEPFCSQTSNCETNLDGLLHGQRLDSGMFILLFCILVQNIHFSFGYIFNFTK